MMQCATCVAPCTGVWRDEHGQPLCGECGRESPLAVHDPLPWREYVRARGGFLVPLAPEWDSLRRIAQKYRPTTRAVARANDAPRRSLPEKTRAEIQRRIKHGRPDGSTVMCTVHRSTRALGAMSRPDGMPRPACAACMAISGAA